MLATLQTERSVQLICTIRTIPIPSPFGDSVRMDPTRRLVAPCSDIAGRTASTARNSAHLDHIGAMLAAGVSQLGCLTVLVNGIAGGRFRASTETVGHRRTRRVRHR